jgi:hypothetical protein
MDMAELLSRRKGTHKDNNVLVGWYTYLYHLYEGG